MLTLGTLPISYLDMRQPKMLVHSCSELLAVGEVGDTQLNSNRYKN